MVSNRCLVIGILPGYYIFLKLLNFSLKQTFLSQKTEEFFYDWPLKTTGPAIWTLLKLYFHLNLDSQHQFYHTILLGSILWLISPRNEVNYQQMPQGASLTIPTIPQWLDSVGNSNPKLYYVKIIVVNLIFQDLNHLGMYMWDWNWVCIVELWL